MTQTKYVVEGLNANKQEKKQLSSQSMTTKIDNEIRRWTHQLDHFTL